MPAPRIGLLLAAAALAATPAAAIAQSQNPAPQGDQVVSTAVGAPAPPTPAPADPYVAWVNDRTDDVASDGGPVKDHAVHGEMSVGVGTRGYREIGGVVTAPLGDDGQATIAIDEGQFGDGRR